MILVLVWWSLPHAISGQDLGAWELLMENAGISSMHTALTHYGTLVMIDRTNIGASQISLPG